MRDTVVMHRMTTAGEALSIVDDDHRVCDAAAVISDTDRVQTWANRFAVLSDPSRLTLLLCIDRAGRICVSDLAVVTGLKTTTVSQALRLLRAEGIVTTHRDGRVIRYELTDDTVRALLGKVVGR